MRRDDDDAATVRKRLTTYAALAEPLIALYRRAPGSSPSTAAAAGPGHRRAVRGDRLGAGSGKSQAPNPKSQAHFQASNCQRTPDTFVIGSCVGIWKLGVRWDLGVGAWDLASLTCAIVRRLAPDSDADRAVVISRVTRRLIPFAFICYVVAYIDRVNIGFAADASCSATSG